MATVTNIIALRMDGIPSLLEPVVRFAADRGAYFNEDFYDFVFDLDPSVNVGTRGQGHLQLFGSFVLPELSSDFSGGRIRSLSFRNDIIDLYSGTLDSFSISDFSFAFDADYFQAVIESGANMPRLIADILDGADRIIGTRYADWLEGFDGKDLLVGGPEGDVLLGGRGVDVASYATARAGLFAGLEDGQYNTGDAAGDIYGSIETLIGSRFDDVLYGDGGRNTLSGGAGDDGLVGKGGADALRGGGGDDTAFYDASPAGLRADLQRPRTNTGHAEGDGYNSIENLAGSSFDDILLGDGADNVIAGNRFPGQSGDDRLFGRGGDDRLSGNDQDDRLNGGRGRDILSGGEGEDVFDYAAAADSGTARPDLVRDFRHGTDLFDLIDIDASTIRRGDDAFRWRGEDRITDSSAGELRYQQIDKSGSRFDITIVYGDTDADRKIEFEIHLRGLVDLDQSDFLL